MPSPTPRGDVVERLDGLRLAEQEALTDLDAQAAQGIGLGFGLDALGDDPTVRDRREVIDAGDERLAGGVVVDATHPGHVELDVRRAQGEDVPEARVPRRSAAVRRRFAVRRLAPGEAAYPAADGRDGAWSRGSAWVG